jgi:hypothetical protein
MASGIIGSGVGSLGIGLALKFKPTAIPRGNELGTDLTVTIFTMALSALAGVLCVIVSIVPISTLGFLGSLNYQDERVTAGKRNTPAATRLDRYRSSCRPCAPSGGQPDGEEPGASFF